MAPPNSHLFYKSDKGQNSGVFGLIRRVCNLYPGEGKKSLQFALMAFFAACAVFAASAIGDGFFLEKIGAEGLTSAYFAIASGMFALASLLLWALGRFPVRLIFTTLILVETAILGCVALQSEPSNTVWWLFKVSQDIFIPLLLTGLWTFFDVCHDLQDAKRLCGIFSASTILGAAAGGSLTWMLLGHLSAQSVLALMCGMLLLSLLIASTADRYAIEEPETQPISQRSVWQTVRGLLTSRFILWLLLFSTCMQLLETVTEFRYMDALTYVFGGDSEGNALTRFLSAGRGYVYIGDVILGVFIYGRLISRFGIGNMILVPPLLFLMLYLLPGNVGLSPALFGLIAVEGVQLVLTETNFNLVINGSPSRMKATVRIAAEYFLEPIGMLIASGLLVLTRGETRLLGLLITAVALLSVFFLRRAYPKAIFHNLVESSLRFDRSAAEWLRGIKLSRLSDEGRQLVQEALAPPALPPGNALEFEQLLPGLQQRATRRATLRALVPCATTEVAHHAPLFIQLLSNTHDAGMRRVCLQILHQLCDLSHLHSLVGAGLHLRPAERRSLERIVIGFGGEAVPALLALTKDAAHDDRLRMIAGRCLGDLSPATLRAELPKLLRREIDRAHFYHYHHETIQRRYPHHDLRLLEDGLLSSFHSVRDFVIHLLGVVGAIDDCELLCHSLRSPHHKIHSQAVETLEKSCRDRRLFRSLLPLIDDRPAVEKLRLYIKAGYTPCTLQEVLGRLERSSLQVDRLVAASLKSQLALPGWEALLDNQPTHPLAYELLEA